MVKSAPRRVFQEMGEPVFVAPLLQARDLLRMRPESTLAVADGGRLVGLVRRDRLSRLAPETPVGSAMEAPISIGLVEPVEAARPLLPIFGADPIPVVDAEDHLVGGLVVTAA
jgi:CBS domain-containing protein